MTEKSKRISSVIPVLCKQKDEYFLLEKGEKVEELPKFFHVLGKNGMYFQNNNNGYHIVRKIEEDEMTTLDEIKENATFNFPTISYDIYIKALTFLRKVYAEYQSEGAILLLMDANKPIGEQEYEVYIPKQEVSMAGVDYKVEEEVLSAGKFIAGSIHSHPDFSAYQSGTDHEDEYNSDGIHITLGRISQAVPEVHQRVCLAGKVYDHKGLLIEIFPPHADKVPDDWMKKVSKYAPTYSSRSRNTMNTGSNKYIKEIWNMLRGVPKNYKSDKILNPIVEEECNELLL